MNKVNSVNMPQEKKTWSLGYMPSWHWKIQHPSWFFKFQIISVQRPCIYLIKNIWTQQITLKFSLKTFLLGLPLVAQWYRICLPVQETQVWSLVREDPACSRATKPVCHHHWACALEHRSRNYWSSGSLEPALCSRTSQHMTSGQRPLLTKTREKPMQQQDSGHPK